MPNLTAVQPAARLQSSKLANSKGLADPSIYDGKLLPNGYQIALANGQLKKARYINPAIEKELAEFKEEIAEKHDASIINKTFVFPRPQLTSEQTILLSPSAPSDGGGTSKPETTLNDYDLLGDAGSGDIDAAFKYDKKQINISSAGQFKKLTTDEDEVELGEVVPVLRHPQKQPRTKPGNLTSTSIRSSSNEGGANGVAKRLH